MKHAGFSDAFISPKKCLSIAEDFGRLDWSKLLSLSKSLRIRRTQKFSII